MKAKRAVLLFETTINGYHHFRVRPLSGPEMPMYLQEEDDNPYDKNAIQVRIPSEPFFPSLNKLKKTKDEQNYMPAPPRKGAPMLLGFRRKTIID